ncbi:MAG: NADH:ubiquinone reductase (Na(+)-transporting) subunit F [Paracoccaceae bacterium]|nr:NADH:ubiquinone reductase (Na(+)-transporting) subunit F [Paracoccaceae bacterium]
MTEIALATALMIALVLALALFVIGARRVLQPALPVTITVNGHREVGGTTGQKLLAALKAAEIPIPSGCAGAGTCGLCKVKVPEGGGPTLPTEIGTLGAHAVAEGLRLACQVVVRGPLRVEVPEAILAAESWPCRVVSNAMLAPLIKELVVELPEGAHFPFEAGAFAQVTARPYALDFGDIEVAPKHEAAWVRMGLRELRAESDEPVSRAYSIANRPEDAGRVVMNIRLAVPPPGHPEAPPGVVSSYLFSLKPGDRLDVAGPYGEFRAKETEREMVFIGGGVGMAPLRAIVHDQLTRRGTARKLSFWYGARSRADLFYEDEFAALAEEHPNFSFTVALSDPAPEDDWKGPKGFIHDVAYRTCLKDHPAPEACEYYLCGPPLMMRAVTAMLEDLGVEPDSIYFDDFAST